jgi:hypothetical protein|tara:strand:- start:2799 stop:3437 length:639 start_codon:yes stop_codon:yes gene_type:complete
MSRPKQIAWESWNAIAEEMLLPKDMVMPEANGDESAYSEIEIPPEFLSPEMFIPQQSFISTPIGTYPEDSCMKPSDRWDCWMGHSNFSITNEISDKIELVDGIEALKIMGRYSFFIGVGKLFDIKDVRTDIEKELCVYTEQEILSNENTQATVDLVKKQLKTEKYWSMLVSPEGEVEYIVSDKMDKGYLEGLSGLLELKKSRGGIILRGNDG